MYKSQPPPRSGCRTSAKAPGAQSQRQPRFGTSGKQVARMNSMLVPSTRHLVSEISPLLSVSTVWLSQLTSPSFCTRPFRCSQVRLLKRKLHTNALVPTPVDRHGCPSLPGADLGAAWLGGRVSTHFVQVLLNDVSLKVVFPNLHSSRQGQGSSPASDATWTRSGGCAPSFRCTCADGEREFQDQRSCPPQGRAGFLTLSSSQPL